jgi:tetratricopeptide (TPR) repeat protein
MSIDLLLVFVLYIGFLLFLIYMIRYTRDRLYVAFLLWYIGLILLAVLIRFTHGSLVFLGVMLDQDIVRNIYLIGGLVAFVLYAEIRIRWPHPFHTEDQLLRHVIELYDQGNSKSALRVARQLVAKSIRRPDALYWQGRILNTLGKHREALRHLRFAHELAPDSLDILLELGLAFKMTGKYREAIRSFENALALDPENASAAGQIEECRRMREGISSA